MTRALAFALVIALSGCAATRSGPTKKQTEYLKVHPLSPDEERRLYAREAKRGDTFDRVVVTFDGCQLEKASAEGDLVIWRVHVPIDERPIRFDTDKLEELPAGGSAMMTFKGDRLQSVMLLE